MIIPHKDIEKYARESAGVTEEELDTAADHKPSCRCPSCQKYWKYHKIKSTIEYWERHKAAGHK